MSEASALGNLARVLLGSAENRLDYGPDLPKNIRLLLGADPINVGGSPAFMPSNAGPDSRIQVQIPYDYRRPFPYPEGARFDSFASQLSNAVRDPLLEMSNRAAFEQKISGAPIVEGRPQHFAALLNELNRQDPNRPSLVRQNLISLALLQNPEFREIASSSGLGRLPTRLLALLAARGINAPGLSIGSIEPGVNAPNASRANLADFYGTTESATQRRLASGAFDPFREEVARLRAGPGISAQEYGPSISLLAQTIKGHPAATANTFNATDVRPDASLRYMGPPDAGMIVPFRDVGGPNIGAPIMGAALDAGQIDIQDRMRLERNSPWFGSPEAIGASGLPQAEPETVLSRVARILKKPVDSLGPNDIQQYRRQAGVMGVEQAMRGLQIPEGAYLHPDGYLVGRDGRPLATERPAASGPLRLPGERTPTLDVASSRKRRSPKETRELKKETQALRRELKAARALELRSRIGTAGERRLQRQKLEERRASAPSASGAPTAPSPVEAPSQRFDRLVMNEIGLTSEDGTFQPSPLQGKESANNLRARAGTQLFAIPDTMFDRVLKSGLVTNPDEAQRIRGLQEVINGSIDEHTRIHEDPASSKSAKRKASFNTMRLVENAINELTPYLGRDAAPFRRHLEEAARMMMEASNVDRAFEGRRLQDPTPPPSEPSNLEKIKKNRILEKRSGNKLTFSDDGTPPVATDDPNILPESRRRGVEASRFMQALGLSEATTASGVMTNDPRKVPQIEADFRRNRDASDLARLPEGKDARERFKAKVKILSALFGKDRNEVFLALTETGNKSRRVDGKLQVTDRGQRKGQTRDLVNFRRMAGALGIDVESITSGALGSPYEREAQSRKLSKQLSDATKIMSALDQLPNDAIQRIVVAADIKRSGGPKELRRVMRNEFNLAPGTKGRSATIAGLPWAPGLGGDGSVRKMPIESRNPDAAVRMSPGRTAVKDGTSTVPVEEFAKESTQRHPNRRQAILEGATPSQMVEIDAALEEHTTSKLRGKPRTLPEDPVLGPENDGAEARARGRGAGRAVAVSTTDAVFDRIFGVDQGTGKRPIKVTIYPQQLKLIRGKSDADFNANLKALATEAYRRGITLDFADETMRLIKGPEGRPVDRKILLRMIQELKDKNSIVPPRNKAEKPKARTKRRLGSYGEKAREALSTPEAALNVNRGPAGLRLNWSNAIQSARRARGR